MTGSLELLTFTVGASTAKWVWKLWVGDGLTGQLGDDMADLVKERIQGRLDRRRTVQLFDNLAESVARRLQPLLEQEFRTLPANEREAALSACAESLDRCRVDVATVLSVDVNASLLEAAVRQQDAYRVNSAGLGEPGSALYDLLLTECCKSVTVIVRELPDFDSAIAIEMLQRQSHLTNLVEQVLEELPVSRVPRTWGAGSEDARFETRYLDRLAEELDELRLFGVDVPSSRRRYSLSVAYISLSATVQEPQSKHSGSEEAAQGDIVRVEAALSEADILVSGLAGSGKTTLLQWLAVASARGNFTAELAEWNDCVPFFVQLRRYINSDFPRPEELISAIVPNLTGAMPPGWAHRILESRRALLLVDGLDELTPDRSAVAHAWLDALLLDFPDNRVIITSRPEGIDGNWRQSNRFRVAELLPMQLHDIRAFISHWHEAARDAAVRYSRQTGQPSAALEVALRAAEGNLLHIVASNPVVRSLASTPLLCALICALHRGRDSHVPDSRMELYEAAMRMLLVSRDEDRDVAVGAGLGLTYTARQLLLQDFAAWLHENHWTDADEGEFFERIEMELPKFTRVATDASAVAKLLIERSGVLTRPLEGRVGFVHKTFQEYLAARAYMQDGSLGKLVLHAHIDHWREVVVLAAGHASPKQCERLILGIVERGEKELPFQQRLFLLAMACLETSAVLRPEVVDRLEGCLATILPPTNMSEAAAIASAGDLAVRGLSSSPKRATEAAACIRALALIGSEAAFDAITAFSSDTRLTVSRQLMREWDRFEPEAYARRVLADSILDSGSLTVTNPEYLPLTRYLRRLTGIFIDTPGRNFPLAQLSPYDKIFGMDASFRDDLRDLTELSELKLRSLWLRRCRNLISLDGLKPDDSLAGNSINLEGCSNLRDVRALSAFERIRYLDLNGTAITSLEPVSRVGHIGNLLVEQVPTLADLGPQLTCRRLSLSNLPALRDLTGLERSQELEKATLGRLGTDVPALVLPDSLEQLTLTSMPTWVPGSTVTGGSGLISLYINWPGESYSLAGLPGFNKLRQLSLASRDHAFSDLDAVLSCENLVQVVFSDYGSNDQVADPFSTLLEGWDRQSTRYSVTYRRAR